MKAIQTILAIAALLSAAITPSEAQGLADITDAISEKRQLTNLPTFYISTVDTVPVVSKDINVKGTLYVAGPAEQAGKYNDSIEIRGRGNSTWGMAKKPYRTKLYKKYNLLDMPAKDKTWPILANYADKSLVRNAVAFEISKLCGLYYTPAYRFVDVVLNDEFLGNYMATDQVEVSGDRVDVVKQATTDSVLPAISGGYLLEIDGFAIMTPVEGAIFPEGFLSANNTPVSIKYPKDDEINKAQRDYIINHFNKFESTILNYKKGDPIDSISKYLNIDSFVNWYIASELSANPDFIWSIYMKKDSGNMQISFGPMW
ncbi:MAG: CotH kinase family protein, partial [Bacteroidales bacterium]|nr:CotH kinase family protein [Bacteroidales bacterium]